MSCVNCQDSGISYTLRAHEATADAEVELTFCSTECLAEWV